MNFEYQPTPAEIKKAEDSMTDAQKEMSEDREFEVVSAAVRARMKASTEGALGTTGQAGETESKPTEQEIDPFTHGGDRGKQVIVETTNR